MKRNVSKIMLFAKVTLLLCISSNPIILEKLPKLLELSNLRLKIGLRYNVYAKTTRMVAVLCGFFAISEMQVFKMTLNLA